METPNFLAKCPVLMFEAAQGSVSWHSRALIGELHMRVLENAFVRLQLRDLLDGQLLFEYTVRDPQVFSTLSQQFFVLRHENGSHKGFGFSNRKAAQETQARIQRAINDLATKITSSSCSQAQNAAVPKVLMSLHQERRKRQRLKFKGLRRLRHLFERSDIEIGYPTDVKHIAHIGWDTTHSMDCSRPPNFTATAFNSDSVDVCVAGSWISSSGSKSPPDPPSYFVD
ncbi:hypothetical protein SELMODRAFT_451613 [Selaginella moellendorffii]|uniref:Uncharacterized protein RIC1-1 n=1 Tax=Selaginella moellendorffii TaxID=88036 RepID=D8SCJ1_SELML|nr:uncharacterized protein LOC9646957 isoform X1 [Selaginella moellendorffii]EFJ17862.1 hypothetical protein SELMODRAFT_451613 [Selaginella moellendorffii]|eukprot:XP_002981161.1 uncharacterized protein LOC9646957 isoform X1 [Selaginella moellendorffii]